MKKADGKRRSFQFSAAFDHVIEAQVAANGASMTENIARGVFLRERVRTCGEPTPAHPQGEELCFRDRATGALRTIDWL